ncbi:SDR family oxidoreductase [Natronomonas gomsonensis]|uniref:SDR family oxidoreductase n=1 Tax=Natronomonas gomsonensis TaxID=1046043 RepID=UPI0020CA6EA5|nr:SDR family oxidoreductase [Natronomonas gomsonensis]MCY4729907.1 SDR family oxidoreductase [Natronomonas gomsonensis]
MDSVQSLDGQTALVTGASRGIGRATAVTLAAHGADVALAARSRDALSAAADEITDEHDVSTVAVPTDVTDENAVESMFETTVDTFDGLDIVVSNAGRAHERRLGDLSTEEYRRLMAVNVDGTFFTARSADPYLRASSGHLVFVGSIAAKYPAPKFPVYAASKWWIRGFALSIAGDLGTDDVATTVVHPTSVRTDIGVEARPESLKETYAPGEVPEPEDIASAVVFSVTRRSPNTVSELDLFCRDQFTGFLGG